MTPAPGVPGLAREFLPVFKRKTRVLSIRLTEEEFRALRQVCISEGFVSFSEFARTAIEELIANRSPSTATDIYAEMKRLRTLIKELRQDLTVLQDLKLMSP